MKKCLVLLFLIAFMLPLSAHADEPAATAEPAQVSKWYDKFDFSGDLRYRFEMLKDEGVDSRYRHRLRARFGFVYALIDEFDLGFRLATNYNDPVSTNQTMGDGFSGKAVRIDLAYFCYHPSYLKGLHFSGGKMKNPFYTPMKSELIWDGDVNPEGLAVSYKHKFSGLDVYLNGSSLYVEERSRAKDSWLFGLQSGGKYKFFDGKMYLGAGASMFYYSNLKNRAPVYDATDSFGNTLNAADNYMYDYQLVEWYGETGGEIYGIPVAVSADFVKNIAKNVQSDLGWLVGFSVGKAKNPWTGAFMYNYRKVGADAVLGLLTDSDFRGGGTDGKGHEFLAKLAVLKGVKVNLNYFFNHKGVTNGAKFHRMMLDLLLAI